MPFATPLCFTVALFDRGGDYTPVEVRCDILELKDPFGTGDSPTDYEIENLSIPDADELNIDPTDSVNIKRVLRFAIMEFSTNENFNPDESA